MTLVCLNHPPQETFSLVALGVGGIQLCSVRSKEKQAQQGQNNDLTLSASPVSHH